MVNILVMKNIKNRFRLFKINPATYFLILTFLMTGLIKNILLIYFIVVFHELGHIVAIKSFGIKIEKVEIYPMGGVTTVDKKINYSINKELIVASMGLIFQIILGWIFSYFRSSGLILDGTLRLFKTYNRAIFMFNLIPIIPLDGEKIVRCLLEKFLAYKLSFYVGLIISGISLVFFISYNQIYSVNNYLIVGFLIFKIGEEWKNFRFRYWRFLMEKNLGDFKYKRFKYHKKKNLDYLKKETYHYFKDKDSYISEKKILGKKFDFK